MRHLKAHRKLGRTTEHRMSLLRNLATSLITAKDERIVTTVPKAKELRSFVERAITLARRASNLENDADGAKTLHLRRQAAAFFHSGNRQQAVARSHYWTNKKAGGKIPERTAGVAAVQRLFDELGERYKDRNGGYTRIIRLGWREGDNAEMAIIELVDNKRDVAAREEAEKKAKEAAAKKKKSTKKKSDDSAE
jgi:large subunit ribosomal protein L17